MDDERNQRSARFVAGASDRWWKSAEGIEAHQRIEEEVWSRHREALARAGWVSRAVLKLRIRNEIAAECARVLWAESPGSQER